MLAATVAAAQTKSSQEEKQDATAAAALTFKVIPSAEGSFGYDVYKGGKMMIHQPSIPGMPGNKGFKDQRTAARVAKLVMTKIRSGQIPPTLTIEELRKEKAID